MTDTPLTGDPELPRMTTSDYAEARERMRGWLDRFGVGTVGDPNVSDAMLHGARLVAALLGRVESLEGALARCDAHATEGIKKLPGDRLALFTGIAYIAREALRAGSPRGCPDCGTTSDEHAFSCGSPRGEEGE